MSLGRVTVSEQDIQNALNKITNIAFEANKELPSRPDGQAYTLMIANPPDDDYYLYFDGDANNMDLATKVIYNLLVAYGLTDADDAMIADDVSATTSFAIDANKLKKLTHPQLNEIVTAYKQICENLVFAEKSKKETTAHPKPTSDLETTTSLPRSEPVVTPHTILTQVFTDFDGTVTGVGGQEVFDTVLSNGQRFSDFMFRNKQDQFSVDVVANELMDNYPQYRIQPGAKDFLIRMANEDKVDLVIISRNYKSYVIAAMRYAEIPDEIINKLANKIYDRETFSNKSEIVDMVSIPGTITTFVLDDSTSDRNNMASAVKSSTINAPVNGTGKFDWNALMNEVIVTTKTDSPKEHVIDDTPKHESSAARIESPKQIVIDATSKKEFLMELGVKLKSGNYSKDHILDFFDELKNKNGKYKFIHEQRNPNFDKFKLLFKSNKNSGESYFWHTKTYQQAVKLLKDAYLDIQKKDNIPADKESTRGWDLINYTRGNAIMHRKHTSAHEEMENIAKPGKK